MASKLSRCTFEPSGEVALVEPGTTVLDAAKSIGVLIQSPCGGRLTCGRCGVRVLRGALFPPEAEEAAKVGKSGVRLSCRAQINGDVVVRPIILPRTRSVSEIESAAQSVIPTPGRITDCSKARLAVGVDLGTTTVSAVVADLDTRVVTGEARVPNGQAGFGADVLTRLSVALSSSDKCIALRDAAQYSILEALTLAAPSRLKDFSKITIAANTVMASLLVGEPAQGLSSSPFNAPKSFVLDAGPLVDTLAACASTVVIEPLVGFVGGDTVAGLVAACSDEPRLPLLFVDIGTNVEAVLIAEDEIICASAPAGSAFAAAGSVGSEVLNTLLSLRKADILSVDGLLDESCPEVSRNKDGIMQVRVESADACSGVASAATTNTCEDSVITQLDIREFQLAKAAVATSIELLLKGQNEKNQNIESVVITGTFGISMPTTLFFELGILPANLAKVTAFEYLRDTSMDGALRISLDQTGDITSSIFNRKITGIDLASTKGFEDVLLSHLKLGPIE